MIGHQFISANSDSVDIQKISVVDLSAGSRVGDPTGFDTIGGGLSLIDVFTTMQCINVEIAKYAPRSPVGPVAGANQGLAHIQTRARAVNAPEPASTEQGADDRAQPEAKTCDAMGSCRRRLGQNRQRAAVVPATRVPHSMNGHRPSIIQQWPPTEQVATFLQTEDIDARRPHQLQQVIPFQIIGPCALHVPGDRAFCRCASFAVPFSYGSDNIKLAFGRASGLHRLRRRTA